MKTLVLSAISALTFSISAAAEPLTGADMSLALGGKMLAGDDGKFYRFYTNGLLEVTGENMDQSLVFGKWRAGPQYLSVTFPGRDDQQFFTLDARGADQSELGIEGFEGALSLTMEPIDGETAISGLLDAPQTIRLQRLLQEGSETAALKPMPEIVNELKPVLLAADALRLLQQSDDNPRDADPNEGLEGAD